MTRSRPSADLGPEGCAAELCAVFDAMMEAVVVIDADDLITQANPAATRILGYDPTGLDRKTMVERLDYHYPDGAPVAYEDLPGVRAQSGEEVRGEMLMRAQAGGTQHHVLVSAAPFEDLTGRRSVVVTFNDITERAALQAQVRRAGELAEALNHINIAIDSDLDVDRMMLAVVGEAAKALGADAAGVAVAEHGTWVARYLHGVPASLEGMTLPPGEAERAEAVARAGAPLVWDENHMDRTGREYAEHFGVNGLLALPVTAHGKLFGVLRFTFHHPVSLGDAELDFAGKLAVGVGLGLANATLLAQERTVSETLQNAALRIPEQVEGIGFGHVYCAAGVEGRVGGDFFDLFDVGTTQVGLVVGDVSGKGLPAAALASLAKNTVRAYALEGHPPATVAASTNDVLIASSETETFVSAFFGLIDKASGRLTYCSAGHPRPMLKRAEGPVEYLDTVPPVLGVFHPVAFVDSETRLGRGDILVVYTDGVIEAKCEDGTRVGEERLYRFLRRLRTPSVQHAATAVLAFVRRCTGGPLADDAVVLTVSTAR